MRRGALVQMTLIALVAAAGGVALAIFIPWLPDSASSEADRIDFVFWLVIGICIFIFAIVASMMVYAITHFRATPDDDSDGPPIHGHTGLEIAWTAIPTVLVTLIGVVSAIVLAKNDRLGSNPLRVHVVAQQFVWNFQYPDAGNISATVLRLPLDRSVQLDFEAKDVIHSFWVPEFGQKQDAVPGLNPTLHITPTRLGRFDVVCTELCGAGHSLMRSQVIVMQPKAFQHWLATQRAATSGGEGEGGGAALGAQVFKNNGCGSCHAFKPAGANATVGPDLDRLSDYARKAGKPVDEFTRESIVDPAAYIEKGYPNVMPGAFSSLPKQQLDALVQYLTTVKG
jgi:cytochrome c oxidase subunit II